MNGRTERLFFLPDGFMQVLDIGFECREKRGLFAQGEIFDCLQWLHGGYDMKFLRFGLSGLAH